MASVVLGWCGPVGSFRSGGVGGAEGCRGLVRGRVVGLVVVVVPVFAGWLWGWVMVGW